MLALPRNAETVKTTVESNSLLPMFLLPLGRVGVSPGEEATVKNRGEGGSGLRATPKSLFPTSDCFPMTAKVAKAVAKEASKAFFLFVLAIRQTAHEDGDREEI